MDIRFRYYVFAPGEPVEKTAFLTTAHASLADHGPGIIVRIKEERQEGPGYSWIPVLAEQLP